MKSKIQFLCLLSAITFGALNAEESNSALSLTIPNDASFAHSIIRAYPETLWLANLDVRKTEEGNEAGLSHSEKLFGQKFVEFDRTIMTLRCLDLILDGSDTAYQEFTKDQKENEKLSRDSFNTLHKQANLILDSKWKNLTRDEIAEAMKVSLVLQDMGKTEVARELFKSYVPNVPDHDDFHGEVMGVIMDHQGLSPSFAKLPSAAKQLLIQSANLAHYGHITHAEGSFNMFSKLKQSSLIETDPIVFAFDVFVHTCDVAGALGHVNNESSLVYREPTHKAMQAMKLSCLSLKDPNRSEKDAYNIYLQKRAAWMGLDINQPEEKILARIGAMLRLFTKEEGSILKNAMEQISANDKKRVLKQLDVLSETNISRTPTYIPALLVNLSNNQELGATREERLEKAITLGLPFVAKVLEKHQRMIAENKADPKNPLNFNKAAGVAKKAPHDLSKGFKIDPEGHVLVKN